MTTLAQAAPKSASTVVLSNVGHGYAHLFMLLYPTVVLALEREFAMPYGELLALSLPGYILFGAAAMPAGWLGDRWSASGMMAIFFVGTGASAVLTGFARTPTEIMIGLGLIGLFASIYHPVGLAYVVRHAENRGRALGVNGVFGSVGIAGAPFVAGALISLVDWRAAFIVPGLCAIATGLWFLSIAGIDRGARGGAKTTADSGVTRAQAIRGLAVLALTSLCAGLIAQCLMVGLPKIVDVRVHVLGDGLLGKSGIVSLVLALGAVGQLAGGWLADRFPLKVVYVTMYALIAPVAFVAAGLDDIGLVVATGMMMLFLLTSVPTENSLVALLCPARWHATAYGAKFVMALGVAASAIPLVGAVYDRTGEFWWLFVFVAAAAATIVAAGLLLPNVGRKAG